MAKSSKDAPKETDARKSVVVKLDADMLKAIRVAAIMADASVADYLAAFISEHWRAEQAEFPFNTVQS